MNNIFRRKRARKNYEINPDEIFLDSSNLPRFDTHQFEGRMEKPISRRTLLFLGVFFILVALLFSIKLSALQIRDGEFYSRLSENNRLQHTPLFPQRGVVFDRNGTRLIWNESFDDSEKTFSKRVYTQSRGFAHILGYIGYPKKDSSGFYIDESYEGKDGIEYSYADELGGQEGLVIVETNALGDIVSKSVIRPVVDGENAVLSIDARVQERLYQEIASLANAVGFNAGAGVIMDVHTGEILALSSYPEYNSNTLTAGSDEIEAYINDPRDPFLNRAISGLYTPGSIVKPFVALAALNERVVMPDDVIISTGSITVPHPYFEDRESIFTDWKAHGPVTIRDALAVSSNVYFYEVAGGYKDQDGVGISRLQAYFELLGFGKETGVDLAGEEEGVIPTPEWKEKTFNDEWRLGDTYNTAIGQYGFQVTPLQAARSISVVANEGTLVSPHIIKKFLEKGATTSPDTANQFSSDKIRYINKEHYFVVKEGMRMAVLEGTAQGLNVPYVSVAAKTGTAEVGISKKRVNSWVTGFFPYENPQFAFAVVMERGPSKNLIGGLFVMRQMLDWMSENTPEYFE